MHNKERANQYQTSYMADYGFESVMVYYRRKQLLECLASYHPEIVVEIGCGAELLYEAWLNNGGYAKCWIIIEPAKEFAERAKMSNLPNLFVIDNFFENAVDSVKEILQNEPNLVICSSLLHEVPSSSMLLSAIKDIMGDNSLLHLNVPNSESLHRCLAKSMKLISETKAMSGRNIQLLQYRVYDMQTLTNDLTRFGFDIIKKGGYFIKPFTHHQMEKIMPILGDNIIDGLYLLGKELYTLASEIYIEAKKGKGLTI